MKNRILFALWGGLFVLCAGLGFIPEPRGAVRWLLTALSILFFVPPMALLRRGSRQVRALIRNLAILSLFLTVVLLIANFLTLTASETVGNIFYCLLVIVTSPMICSGYWALSLFLWAYLMIAAMKELKKK